MQENNVHSIQIEQRKNISVSAVEGVVSFSEVKIVLALQGGERLTIIGTELKILGFSKTNGSFLAEGTVVSVAYGGKSFVSKLFK